MRFGLRWHSRDLGRIPGEAGVVKARSGDVAVSKAIFLTPASTCTDDNHLLIAHALGRLQTVNPHVAEMRCENLAAPSQSLSRDDKHQNSPGLQPAIRVA